MNNSQTLSLQLFLKADEFTRIGNRAICKAKAENHRLGIPNIFSRNGCIYCELPNGEIVKKDPFKNICLA